MTELEIKNFQTQLHLYKEIQSADNMILHYVRSEGGSLLSRIIKDKMFFKDGQTTVKLTADEFTEIRLFLARISPETNGLKEIGHGHIEKYIDEKEAKLKIISMLS